MKKTVFLILAAMAILFSGCTGHSYRQSTSDDLGSWMINSTPPIPLNSDLNYGINLPISSQSTLSIDVECIIDYAQGESTIGPQDEQGYAMNPWVLYQITF
jgi:hypothetical protein